MIGRSDITPKTRAAVKQRDGMFCTYCNAVLRHITIDHVDPRGTNELDNLTVACGDCNTLKHARPLLVFLALRALRGWPQYQQPMIIDERLESGRERWMRESGDNWEKELFDAAGYR